MKNFVLTWMLCLGCFLCKSQDTIRYAVNGSADTRLIKMKDSVSIRILSKQKNLLYRVVNVKLTFKFYDMKMLKTIGDTLISFPVKFRKNPVAVFNPGNIAMFKKAEALIITSGDIISKDKKGKTQTISGSLGKEREFQVVK